MSVLGSQLAVIGGKFRFIDDMDAYAEVVYLESLAKQYDLEEHQEEVIEAFIGKKIVSPGEANRVVAQLFSIKTFGELVTFFQTVPLALSATVRANVVLFIDENIRFFGEKYPVDLEALQAFVEIIIDEEEVLQQLGEGGEGIVFKSQRTPTPQTERDEGVASPPCPETGRRHTHALAIKFLLKGNYEMDHSEVQASLTRTPGVLPISCVRQLIQPQCKEPKIGLVMEMGKRTVSQAVRAEPTLQGKLMILLQMAHKVADLHRRGVVHMDLKFQNALMMRDGRIELIDASFAKQVGDAAPKRPMTFIYSSPPESVNTQMSEHSMKVEAFFDMWSFGIMQYEVLMDGPPDLGGGFPFIYAMMSGSYIGKMFPEKSVEALHADLGKGIEILLDETKTTLSPAIDLLFCRSRTERYINNYEAKKAEFMAILKMPCDQMTLEDVMKAKQFFNNLPSGFSSDYESMGELENIFSNLYLRMKMEAHPELVEIIKRLISFEAAVRGDINLYIRELSQYLAAHR